MQLPFTIEEFLGVFEAYNLDMWPMQVVLFLAGIVVVLSAMRTFVMSDRIVNGILGLFWLWMGIVYHFTYFSKINPGAYIFGAVFILQALLFLYAFHKDLIAYRFRPDVHGWTGLALIVFALIVYPLLGYMLGHVYPQSPTFGLPCPTTIFTFGVMLLCIKRIPFYFLVIPLLWSFIGVTAAITLGMTEDISLVVAALITVMLLYWPGMKKDAAKAIPGGEGRQSAS